MLRPELLSLHGDTAAAQASLALAILTDKDVFYAGLEYSIGELETKLTAMQEVLTQEHNVQVDLPDRSKTLIELPEGDDIASLAVAVGARETNRVYLRGREKQARKHLLGIQTWFQLNSPGFAATTLKQRHFAPIVSRVNKTGNVQLAQDLEDALSAIPTWNPNAAFYSGDLEPYRTTHYPEVVGGSAPFTVEDGGDIVVTCAGVEYTWSIPTAVAPFVVGPATTRTFAEGAQASMLLDSGGAAFDTKADDGMDLTVDGTVLVTADAGTFTDAVAGQYLKIDGSFYEIVNVVSDQAVWVGSAPGAGVYNDCELHWPYSFPITIACPSEDVFGTSYTVDLEAFGTFSGSDLQDAFEAVVPDGALEYDATAGTLTITVPDEDDEAAIIAHGTDASYPLGYEVVGITPGAAEYGVTDTSLVSVKYRAVGGLIATDTATLTGTLTPEQMADALEEQLEDSCVVEYDDDRDAVTFTGLTQGPTEPLVVSMLSSVWKVWGSSPSLPDPPAPLQLLYPNPIRVGPYETTLDNTKVIVLDFEVSSLVTADWRVEVQLAEQKHWASYSPVSIVIDGTTTITLAAAPFDSGTAIVRFVYQPITLRCVSAAAASSIAVDSSAAATALEIAGESAQGRTTNFVVVPGAKAGYLVYPSAGATPYRVVDVTSEEMVLDTILTSETLESISVKSPGMTSMSTYQSIKRLGFPRVVKFSKNELAATLERTTTLLEMIQSSDRYAALQSEEFDQVTDFCADRKLELAQVLLESGAISMFFAAARGTARQELGEGSTGYSEHATL